MLRKTFTITKSVDDVAPQLELFLTLVAKSAMQFSTGTYTGTGVETSLTVTFAPVLVLIRPKYPATTTYPITNTGSNNVVIGFQALPGDSWVVGTGYVNDAILSYTNNQIVIGSNVNVNTPNQDYQYFLIG